MIGSLPTVWIAMVIGLNLSSDSSAFFQSNLPSIAAQRTMIQQIKEKNPQIDTLALIAGVRAYDHLRIQGKDLQQLLTIINFKQPSNVKRLWVIDMNRGEVKYRTFVAQGTNTGYRVATHFSNRTGSHESSIGVYLTGKTYRGVDGYSMRLYGLDKGFNNNAYERAIVMHPARYVNSIFAKRYGRVGNTFGCFGLDPKIAP